MRIGAHKWAPEQFTRDGAIRRGEGRPRGHAARVRRCISRRTWRRGATSRPLPAERRSLRGRSSRKKPITERTWSTATAFDDELERRGHRRGRRAPASATRRAARPCGPEPLRRSARRRHHLRRRRHRRRQSRDIPHPRHEAGRLVHHRQGAQGGAREPRIGAVVLRIESPGGSSLAADVMWREAELTAKVSRSSSRWAARGERRLLHRRAGQAHLREAAHDHRQHRHLLRQGRRERAAQEASASTSRSARRRRAPTPSRSTAASPKTSAPSSRTRCVSSTRCSSIGWRRAVR